MKSIVAAAAMSVALIACGQKPANQSNTAAPSNQAVPANAATANSSAAAPASWGEASPPPAAYAGIFNERWNGPTDVVTPAEVAEKLRTQTPQQVIGWLWGETEETRWASVARSIAKGDPAWLALAPQISRGTDAGTSDDFAIAASDALTTNPTGTLRLLSQIEMGTGACGENGFEVEPAQAQAYFDAAIAKVETVTDPALQQIKNACLASLRQGLAGYPGLNGNPPQKL